MKGKMPSLKNVVPMKGGIQRHVAEVPQVSHLYFMQMRLTVPYSCVMQMT